MLQIWVLSWKGSSSLSPSWRLLGRNQKGLHKGMFRPATGSKTDFPGLTDLHHKLWRVQTCTQLPQGNTTFLVQASFKSLKIKWYSILHWPESFGINLIIQVAGYKYIGRVCQKDPDQAYDYFSKVWTLVYCSLESQNKLSLLINIMTIIEDLSYQELFERQYLILKGVSVWLLPLVSQCRPLRFCKPLFGGC